MMWERKEVCGCCHAEYFVDENNNWQLVETGRIAALEAENEQLQRRYEGQRTAARVNWDKVKALEAQIAALAWTHLIDDKGLPIEGAELPHNGRTVDITFYRPALNQLGTYVAQHKMGRWVYCESGDDMPVGQDTFIIVAWRERPTPAPYPE